MHLCRAFIYQLKRKAGLWRRAAGRSDSPGGQRITGQLLQILIEGIGSAFQPVHAELWVQQATMEVLRRSSVFAAEVMEVFDRSPTDKELVSQAKALCRDYINSRLIQAGVSWSKPEYNTPVPGGKLAEVSTILLRLGESCWHGGNSDCGEIRTRLRLSCDATEVFLLCFWLLVLVLVIFPKQLLCLSFLSLLEHCSARGFCKAAFFWGLATAQNHKAVQESPAAN